jgi:hypothetical protein
MAPKRKFVRRHPKVNDNLFGRVKQAPIKIKCPLCAGAHTLNQHRFHGRGSSLRVFRNDQ